VEIVLRSVAIYLFLLVVVRLTGKRSLAQITPFDLVLVLIISEATQQGLIGDDYSLSRALLVILTLVLMDIGFSLAKQRSRRLDTWLEGKPVILVEHGRPIEEHLRKSRVDVADVLESAREMRGLVRLDQIRYAVLERSGFISIIPE
jgi:uncharacterized membrane protein YcaP (DUF421 family)